MKKLSKLILVALLTLVSAQSINANDEKDEQNIAIENEMNQPIIVLKI